MKIKCPQCDFENEEDSKFCKNCNVPLSKQDYSEDNPYIKKNINEEEKIRKKIERTEVTLEELGKVLCLFSHDMTHMYLNNKENLESLDIKKDDNNNVFLEIIEVLFFLIFVQIDGLFKDEKLRNRILDSMHEAHYKLMDLDKTGITVAKTHFIKRYIEYTNASKEKRGPDWLWPVTSHALNNLRQEETKDFFAMMTLTHILSSITNNISDLIKNKYKIIDE